MIPSVAWSDFARTHSRFGTGNSYTTLDDDLLVSLVQDQWEHRTPGTGETNLSRKVLVPMFPEHNNEPVFFLPPRVPLVVGMPIRAEVVVRQDGEDPYIETYITPDDAVQWGYKPVPATEVNVVCYSAEALLENGGKRSSDAEWEIVTILCSDVSHEPMFPLAMARNFLEKPGGTKGVYTAQEFAESIYFHSNRGVRVRNSRL